jgi:hypothetical protein
MRTTAPFSPVSSCGQLISCEFAVTDKQIRQASKIPANFIFTPDFSNKVHRILPDSIRQSCYARQKLKPIYYTAVLASMDITGRPSTGFLAKPSKCFTDPKIVLGSIDQQLMEQRSVGLTNIGSPPQIDVLLNDFTRRNVEHDI